MRAPAGSPRCAIRSKAWRRNTGRVSSPIRAGTPCNDSFRRRAGALFRSGATGRRHRRQGGQDHRARLAARPRQGQSHRQCALRQGGGRQHDPADHLHRADARAAARQARVGAAFPRSHDAAAVRRLSAARVRGGDPYAQQHYICANYTHAMRYVLVRGVNVVAQLVAHRADEAPQAYSVSCNPDLTLDLLARRRDGGADFLFAGQVNSELPFMPGDAAIGENEFDLMLDGAATDFPLFAAPREPVALADYAAGLHAASIVPDGGTLQIGIGSLGEAVAQALVLRQHDNDAFGSLLSRLGYDPARDAAVHAEKFEAGLYGCSELFVEGMLDLYRAGILKREVDGIVLHAGFFLGSRGFYRSLRDMPREVVRKFGMTSIAFVNEIY